MSDPRTRCLTWPAAHTGSDNALYVLYVVSE